MELTNCPECGAVAEVQWRTDLESTAGYVEHVKVLCLNRHGFFLPAEALAVAGPVPGLPVARPLP